VNSTQPRTGQHGDQSFSYHGHVNQHPISFGYPLGRQGTGKPGDLIPQLVVSVFFNRLGDGAVVYDCILVATTIFDMSIDLAAAEPAIKGFIGIIEYLVPFFIPVTILRGFGPERIGVFNGLFTTPTSRRIRSFI
jgi:hypothetical protein